MQLTVLNITKTETGKQELPVQFSEPVRPDLIKRAVEALQNRRRQPYGADPMAGKKCSAEVSRRRRKYRGSYGHGISRVPRKVLTRRGTRFYWVGAFAPGTVGGRRAHPPKAEKNWTRKINEKENSKAIRSALAATVIKEAVANRGHKTPNNYPFLIEDAFETLNKTKLVRETLIKLGLKDELERSSKRTIRAGKGKLRGRKYIKKKGPLLVVSKQCPLIKSGRNVPGVEVVEVNALNAEILAPGTAVGRLTIFTTGAIERMNKEKLFMNIKNESTQSDKKSTSN
jgi:large subunit ribosomal protein L4e